MEGGLFLTGGTGFVGRHFLRHLGSGEPGSVLALARDSERLPGCGEIPVEGDLVEPAAWQERLRGCRTVVHLAAVTGKVPRKEYDRVNVEGTRGLLRAARDAGVERFLFVSSVAARYGDTPRYWYGRSKQEAENLVRESDLETLIIRPTIVLGRDSPVVHILSKLAGAPIVPIFGSGRTRVQPIEVGDLVHGMVTALEADRLSGETWELGGPEILEIEDLVMRIRRILHGKDPRRIHIPVGLLSMVLGLLEPIALPLLPFTAGQLSSFIRDGTTTVNPLSESLLPGMKKVDEVLEGIARG